MACVLVERRPYPIGGTGTFRAYHCAAPILNTQPEHVAIPRAKCLWVCAMEEYPAKCRNPRHLFPPDQHWILTPCPGDSKARSGMPVLEQIRRHRSATPSPPVAPHAIPETASLLEPASTKSPGFLTPRSSAGREFYANVRFKPQLQQRR